MAEVALDGLLLFSVPTAAAEIVKVIAHSFSRESPLNSDSRYL